MPFNIDAFKAYIENSGYLTTNKFEVRVYPPINVQGGFFSTLMSEAYSFGTSREMKFRIDSVRIPGINILSADINHFGVGPTQKQPFSAQFNENNISILTDAYGEIWQFWHNWVTSIFDFTDPTFGYISKYKQDYASTIEIIVYDQEGSAAQIITLNEAFPTTIRDVPLSWNEQGNLIRMNIGIAYTNYDIQNLGF